MFNSTKTCSGSKSLNKTSPGFFLKSLVALALSLVLVAALILVAWFTVKQRKASNAQGTPAAAVIAPTPPAEASPKATPAKPTPPPAKDPFYARLAGTIIPTVTFRDVPLSQVLATLSDLSTTYDPDKKGFHILYIDRENKNPLVSIQVTNMPLDRIFDYIALPKDFGWRVNHGVVEFRPNSGPQVPLEARRLTPPSAKDPLYARLAATIIPTATFRDAPLDQVLATLSDLSSTYEPEKKGFNILWIDHKNKKPLVSIQVTNLSLDRTFDYIAQATDSEWKVNRGVIEFRPNTDPQASLEPKVPSKAKKSKP
jgi:hypothetical protein